MYLCRFSVRYASSANSVLKPINFKHTPRIDEITEPFRSNRDNKKYDSRSRRSSRDDRENNPSVGERDEEGMAVIRSPIAPIQRSDYGFGDERPRRPSRDEGYEGDREDGDIHFSNRRNNRSFEDDREEGDGHFPRRRRNNDDVGVFTNRGKHEDYRDSSKNNQGRFRGRQAADYRPGKFDSRYNNDEFRRRNFDYHQGNGEYKRDNYSSERHVRDHNNSRMRQDESDYGSKKHINRGHSEKLSILSSDSSLGDVENLFGIHPVLLALRAGKRTIHKIFCKQGIEKTNTLIKQIYELAAGNSIEFVSVHGSEIGKVFKGDTVHQGIFCLASPLPVSVFNIDSCQELPSSLIDSVILEDSSTTKEHLGCSDASPHNLPDDTFNNSSLDSYNIARSAGDAPLGSISDSLSGQEEQGSSPFSAQRSLNSSLNIETADSNPTKAASETITNSISCTEPSPRDATPPSVLPDESLTGISSPMSLSTLALSSAVAFAAMKPEQDDTSGANHLTAVASSEEEELEQEGSSNTMVTSSSEVWQQSDSQSKPQLWVLLDSVVDAMNVGAVLRSCCYFGVDRVLFTPSCAEISPVVSKASSGAVELLPLSLVPQPGPTLAALRGRGWRILVAVSRGAESPHKPRPLHEYAMTGNTLLVVGNEGSGISASISEQADDSVTIPATGPLAGALGCLNVSVAAAITLHALTSKT